MAKSNIIRVLVIAIAVAIAAGSISGCGEDKGKRRARLDKSVDPNGKKDDPVTTPPAEELTDEQKKLIAEVQAVDAETKALQETEGSAVERSTLPLGKYTLTSVRTVLSFTGSKTDGSENARIGLLALTDGKSEAQATAIVAGSLTEGVALRSILVPITFNQKKGEANPESINMFAENLALNIQTNAPAETTLGFSEATFSVKDDVRETLLNVAMNEQSNYVAKTSDGKEMAIQIRKLETGEVRIVINVSEQVATEENPTTFQRNIILTYSFEAEVPQQEEKPLDESTDPVDPAAEPAQ